MGFAEQALKTPYATTPMLANHRRVRLDVEDEEGSLLFTDAGEERALLQRLEDSVGLLRGELGVCAPNARYITLHGGAGALGDNYVRLHDDLRLLAQRLSVAGLQVKDAKDEARQARAEAAAMGAELEQLCCGGVSSRLLDGLNTELQEAKADRGALKDMVLALTTTVTGLMEVGMAATPSERASDDINACLAAHAAAVNGRLDSIRQEMKGGGITVGSVTFSGQETAMDWARIHLPPNTYQCIGGMVYAMCLISEAVVHQEDTMKHEEHGERVQRTFMQSAQVLSVHTLYPPVYTADVAEWLDRRFK